MSLFFIIYCSVTFFSFNKALYLTKSILTGTMDMLLRKVSFQMYV